CATSAWGSTGTCSADARALIVRRPSEPAMLELSNDRSIDSGRCLVGDGDSADVGVLLMNMGGPDDPASVEPFLRNLFSDRGIIQLPGGRLGQRLLADCIVRSRLAKVKRAYGRLGGGSPL